MIYRKLTPIELAWVYLGKMATPNVCRQIELQGPLDLDRFQSALCELQRRHILFQSTLDVKNKAFVSCHRLLHAKVCSIDAAKDLFATELTIPFELGEDLLLRVNVIETSQESWLFVITYHHVIGDMYTIINFIHELFTIYVIPVSGEINAQQTLPLELKKSFPKGLQMLKFLAKNVLSRCVNSIARDLKLSTQSQMLTIPPQKSAQLIELAQQHQISVHDVLWSCLLKAYVKQHDNKAQSIETTCFIDLRHSIEDKSYKNLLGCWITLTKIALTIKPDADVFAVAKTLREKRKKNNKTAFAMACFGDWLFQLMLLVNRRRFGQVAITGGSHFYLNKTYGDLTIISTHGCYASNSIFADVMLNFSVFFDQIFMTFSYATPAVREEMAVGVWHDFQQQIDNLLKEVA
ncbi:MAG: condensation domain-containing protein [Legionellales bacterium]|jgi:NRPS condensation-like uncharacterized protein